jgi:hypothetical protein
MAARVATAGTRRLRSAFSGILKSLVAAKSQMMDHNRRRRFPGCQSAQHACVYGEFLRFKLIQKYPSQIVEFEGRKKPFDNTFFPA